MKTRVLFLFTILSFSFSNAQIVNIPNANFKARLLQASTTQFIAFNSAGVRMKIDTNNDSEIQVSEALLVYQLKVPSRNIASMTGVESFTNLRVLECYLNQITALNVTALTNLTDLKCYNNQLTSLNVSNLINLTILQFTNNQITSIDLTNLVNLSRLDTSNNPLMSLNVSNQTQLIDLNCYQNQLTTLNLSSLNGLLYLSCYNNQLTSLNLTSQVNLIKLNCSTNQLSSLSIPAAGSLKYLYFTQNSISNFNFNSFPLLEELSIGQNPLVPSNLNSLINLKTLQITYLDISYINSVISNSANFPLLEYLDCSNVAITSINLTNTQFPNLIQLVARNCGLTQLQISNVTLENLFFNTNNVANIDLTNLPNLQQFEAWNNPLSNITFNFTAPLWVIAVGGVGFTYTNLDFSLFTQLSLLSVSNCELLNSLNIKNGSNEGDLTFSNCPNLEYICADENQLAAVQTKINTYGYTNCYVNSYCSFVPGGTYYTIQGNNKFDSNSNGCNASDGAFPNLKLNITNGTNTANLIPNASGNYTYNVQSGTNTITPVLENPSYFTITPASATVTFPSTTSSFTQNFCIVPNGSFSDLEVVLIPLNNARPGFDSFYKIIYKNKGVLPVASGTVILNYNNPVLDYVSATPIFSNQDATSFTWSFTNLQPFETREILLTLNLNSPTESPALNNCDILIYSAVVNGGINEVTPIDNASTLNQNVVNSFDPNDKTCLEGTTVSPSMVGQYVHYVIRFENNGTANAENIVVKDIIDISKFDITSLIPLSASHLYTTRIINSNQVEFIFQNINLPFDNANNDGYVAFKIKTKSNLVVGDTFSNLANIYFDYNYPIITNNYITTVQTLGINETIADGNISIYPNPVKDIIHFDTQENVIKVEVYDIAGRILSSNSVNDNKLNLSDLQTGNYILKAYTESSIINTKIIKE